MKDYPNITAILAEIDTGKLQSFSMAESVHPMTGLLEVSLGSLAPKEVLPVTGVLAKEHQMAARQRGLNLRIKEIRAKKIEDPKARITVELHDMKIALKDYLKREVEQILLIYHALSILNVKDFIYSDGKTRSHSDMLELWQGIGRGEKILTNLLPYIPWRSDKYDVKNEHDKE